MKNIKRILGVVLGSICTLTANTFAYAESEKSMFFAELKKTSDNDVSGMETEDIAINADTAAANKSEEQETVEKKEEAISREDDYDGLTSLFAVAVLAGIGAAVAKKVNE